MVTLKLLGRSVFSINTIILNWYHKLKNFGKSIGIVWIVQLYLQHNLGVGCDSNHCCVMELLLDRTNYLNWFFDWLFVCQNCKRWAAAFLQFFVMRKRNCHVNTGPLRFADGKYRRATVATPALRKKWSAAARANWKTNLGESRGIPGRDFRCRWLTPLFAKQMKSIFALSHFASTAVFLVGSRTRIVDWWSYTVKVSALKLR